MNVTREEIFGIDKTIQAVQSSLYEYLASIWQGSVYGYGRAYKNVGAQGTVKPELYVGGGDYKDVFLDDRKSASFFFLQGDSDNTSDDLLFTSDVKVIVMVNLDKIYEKKGERNDARAESDVIKALREFEMGRYTINRTQRGLRNVFSGMDIESIKFSDIHPYYCFSVDLDLEYYTTDNCY